MRICTDAERRLSVSCSLVIKRRVHFRSHGWSRFMLHNMGAFLPTPDVHFDQKWPFNRLCTYSVINGSYRLYYYSALISRRSAKRRQLRQVELLRKTQRALIFRLLGRAARIYWLAACTKNAEILSQEYLV